MTSDMNNDEAYEEWLAPLALAIARAQENTTGASVVGLAIDEPRIGDVVMDRALRRALARSSALRAAFAAAPARSETSSRVAVGDPETFTMSVVGTSDAAALATLAKAEGADLLEPENRRIIAEACTNHEGVMMRAPDRTIIGCCFATRRAVRFQRATHWAPDEQTVTYLHQFLVAKAYRNRGLGQALLRCAIAYEYGKSDGLFPDVVGVAYSGASNASPSATGFVRFPSFASDIHRSALAVKTMVQQSRGAGVTTDVVCQVLDMGCMPAIATWALNAYDPNGVRDEIRGTVVHMIDESCGRNGVVAELYNLANGHPRALERLGLAGRQQAIASSA